MNSAFLGLLTIACSEYALFGEKTTVVEPHYSPLQPKSVTDRFTIYENPPQDLLFLIDNSCSMGPYQTKLASNVDVFLDWFLYTDIDFHAGVVTTDMYDEAQQGSLVEAYGYKWVDESTVNPEKVFAEMALPGVNGNFNEKGREPIYYALEIKRMSDNKGFLRKEASLHIIAITDEPDHSSDTVISQAEFLAWLEHFKVDKPVVTFSGILGQSSTTYDEIISYIGGSRQSISTEDWLPILDNIKDDILPVRQSYPLSYVPELSSIEVHLQRGNNTLVLEPWEWWYEQIPNSISIETEILDKEDIIEITYNLATY